MRTGFCLALLVLTNAVTAAPTAPDATLGFYLKASSIAVAGEVVSDPVKEKKLFSYQRDGEEERAVYSVRIKVLEQFHGPTLSKDTTIVLVRWAHPGERTPTGVKKGDKYVFFLNWNYGTLGPHTADPCFGVQPYNATMALSLRRMGTRPAN